MGISQVSLSFLFIARGCWWIRILGLSDERESRCSFFLSLLLQSGVLALFDTLASNDLTYCWLAWSYRSSGITRQSSSLFPLTTSTPFSLSLNEVSACKSSSLSSRLSNYSWVDLGQRGFSRVLAHSLSIIPQLLSVQQTKMASSSSSVFASTLTPRVPSLVRSTLIAVAGAVPRSHLVSLSELLHACLLRIPEQARPALKELLSTPSWPNERTTEEARSKFERSVLRYSFHSLSSFTLSRWSFFVRL